MSSGPFPYVTALRCSCCPHPMGAVPVPWVLAPSCWCWPCPTGAGSVRGPVALTRAPADECLESLKKVRIPPSSTVQDELQFFLGTRRGGSCLGTAQAQVSPRPPRARVVAGGARGHAYRNRFPLSAILVLLSTPALSRLLNWKFRHREGGGSAFLLTGWQRPPALCIPQGGGTLVLTFSSFSPSAAGVQLGQARSPLSWLELLLARCCRLPAGTWGTATR